VRRDLHFVLPSHEAEQTLAFQVKLGATGAFRDEVLKAEMFSWLDQPGAYAELLFGSDQKQVPVMRYMCRTFDDSSKDARDKSYKVFHHLYDPEGKRFVTNGGQTNENVSDPKKLLFPHHRGLMYAFNRISYGSELKKKADTWHATGDAHQTHEGYLNVEAGPVLGRHRVQVDWHGEKKEVFAREERELTVYKVPGGTLVEFASRLKTTNGKVRLDGDPQHAGFQFRASNDVAEKTAKQTYYVRPDGKGKLGDTRNWDPKTMQGPVDLPWDVLSFVLDDKRYSVAYLNQPTNPKESRFSERDYGRFGCYFAYDLTETNPLIVNYRVWLQDGEMTGEQATALHNAFINPPRGTVK
jgi:hypothetical protein